MVRNEYIYLTDILPFIGDFGLIKHLNLHFQLIKKYLL